MSEGVLPTHLKLCIDNADTGILNIDFLNNFKNISTDISAHQCHLEKLPEIVLDFEQPDEETSAGDHLAILEEKDE